MGTGTRQARLEWEARYRSGPTPWDTGVTPPEVKDFWRSGLLPSRGRALDMGCGTGTNSLYLASLGLHVIGLELSRRALIKACDNLARAPQNGIGTVHFVQCDVSMPPVRQFRAMYILDIGCLHGLPRSRRPDYTSALIENLAPGGYYHLYSHDAPSRPTQDDESVRGLREDEVEHLFTPHLTLLTVSRGKPDPRPSRWYLLHKAMD